MNKLAPVLLMSCVFLLWLGIMLSLARIVLLGLKSKSWPNTYGKITQSQIIKAKRSETGSFLTHYRTVIQYEYIVGDVSYKSQTLSFPDQAWQILNRGLRSLRVAKTLQTKYPMNQSIEVYYNPKNPRQSVLEPIIADKNFILLLIIFLVMGMLFAAILIQ
ncbi:MAG: DUF3592 domain-containing protein [Chloroflexota bacterium]